MMLKKDQFSVYNLGKTPDKWEPFVVEGMEIGQVSWLRQTQDDNGVLAAGLWKHRREEHPNGMPYGVDGNETFYVLQGEAEIETNTGETMLLEEGNSYSFTDGFTGLWRTKKDFIKFFVVS
ncbi:cupin domain-containing protein [Aquibacillus sediminis]|uniref:cupin domain-containing protein n=1 Tax=Aquibacillus sediminis TaxID=2574734 RepID=UPI00110980FD|nr:cupin domain-containing protein [Aquibacillus sediminis]